MKKHFLNLLTIALLVPATTFAGGLFTNTNQSASFLRQPAQDAVLDATGTYFNPAGLAFLSEGFHFSLNNQTIFQNRKISSTFPNLARTEFEGEVFAPLFPSVYAVYKTGQFAFSLGVNPIGGGGSAKFENGLPSFESQVAVLPGSLTAAGIATSQYSMDALFDGSSINWGVQVNGSYALNDVLSFSAGLRYIMANNSYNGHLKDISINPMHPLNASGPGNMISAPAFFSTVAGASTMAANSLNPVIANNAGGLTLAQLVALNVLNQDQANQLAGGLGASYNQAMTAQQIQTAYQGIAGQMTALAASTSDRQLEATQSGTGIAPVFGMNIKFSDDLNFAVKYEHKASITLTNSTVTDDVGMYPDGAEVKADMPAMLAAGLTYWATPSLRLSGGFHYYFDKQADYGRTIPNDQLIDRNFIEIAVGAEYALTRQLIASVGYLRTQTGVNDVYHSDLSHSLNTNSIGAGLKYFINRNVAVNLGVMNTLYESYTKNLSAGALNFNEEYNRSALSIGIGLDFRF